MQFFQFLFDILAYLFQHYGKICLSDCTLIEDPSSEIFFFEEDGMPVLRYFLNLD